ncbi:X-linked retinitis pigmentosa GTPase regulator [Nymphon striatum]|nr:X-linked retinitis pigmentosa GTPase regulator [Nymphon striatum]
MLHSKGGIVHTFGRSRFAGNAQSQFWIRDDAILDMACGDEHSAVITANGRLLTFGSNEWGQLGHGNCETNLKPTTVKALKHEKSVGIACGRAHTLVATDSGKVFAFGSNTDGQLGISETSTTQNPTVIIDLPEVQYKLLSAGVEHSAALTETGKLYIWGSSRVGQLGLGEGVSEALKPVELKFSSPVTDVSCGYYQTAVVTGWYEIKMLSILSANSMLIRNLNEMLYGINKD